MLADAARRQVEHPGQRLLDLALVHAFPARSVQVDVDRQRLRHANGVGELDGAAPRQPRRHHVLGEVAGRVGRRAVDLRWILAGECAAAMGSRAAVGVDDDLAPGEAGVAVRPADIELAGGVDVPDRVLADPALRQRLADIRLDDGAHVLGGEILVEVLVRHHNLGDAGGLAALVLHRHLALGVGAELDGVALAGAAGVRKLLQDAMRIMDRRRHQVRRLVAGVAEHDALVARADVLVAGRVHALGDVGGLAVQQHLDRGVVPVEARLFVADVPDGAARRRDDLVAGHRRRPAVFARDHHAVGGGERFAGDPDLAGIETRGCGLAVEQVHDLVRNSVAHLVGVAFGHGFAREQIVLPRHAGLSRDWPLVGLAADRQESHRRWRSAFLPRVDLLAGLRIAVKARTDRRRSAPQSPPAAWRVSPDWRSP